MSSVVTENEHHGDSKFNAQSCWSDLLKIVIHGKYDQS